MTRKESKLFVRKSLIKDYRRREASVEGYSRFDRKAPNTSSVCSCVSSNMRVPGSGASSSEASCTGISSPEGDKNATGNGIKSGSLVG